MLKDILNLEDNVEIQLKGNGIFFLSDESEVELKAIGDGHRSLTTLTLDILSWIYLYKFKEVKGNVWDPIYVSEVKGIVIIDEMEKHLHPSLQRKIISQLHEKFKNIQFIISTHSPLCVSGTADVGEIDNPEYIIYSSYINEEGNADLEELDIPKGLRYDQILIDYFKLPTTINEKLESIILRLRELFMKEVLEPDEQNELNKLDKTLKEYYPLLSEGLEERKTEINILNITEKLKNQLIKDGLLDD